MNCHRVQELSSEYVDDVLTAGERARFEDHLVRCPSCRRELDSLREVIAGIASLTEIPAPSTFCERLLQATEGSPRLEQPAPARVPAEPGPVAIFLKIAPLAVAALVLVTFTVLFFFQPDPEHWGEPELTALLDEVSQQEEGQPSLEAKREWLERRGSLGQEPEKSIEAELDARGDLPADRGEVAKNEDANSRLKSLGYAGKGASRSRLARRGAATADAESKDKATSERQRASIIAGKKRRSASAGVAGPRTAQNGSVHLPFVDKHPQTGESFNLLVVETAPESLEGLTASFGRARFALYRSVSGEELGFDRKVKNELDSLGSEVLGFFDFNAADYQTTLEQLTDLGAEGIYAMTVPETLVLNDPFLGEVLKPLEGGDLKADWEEERGATVTQVAYHVVWPAGSPKAAAAAASAPEEPRSVPPFVINLGRFVARHVPEKQARSLPAKRGAMHRAEEGVELRKIVPNNRKAREKKPGASGDPSEVQDRLKPKVRKIRVLFIQKR